ncbi:hypothetical protein AVEN_3300-1 [Araneus ventricosus]|uniref:Uncharacterized protein n=1 Tax=Araneus ventricosus TaxID=182803 RepID=A0A4Y2SPX0_ARAVE|nr:hypothetical protein AVEN_3300-1 [Araneus ventricosus]
MIQPVLPEVQLLLQSPSEEETKSAIQIVSTHPSPFEELAIKRTAAMTRIRATLARAKVAKSNRKGVLEGANSLLAVLYQQANEIGMLKAKGFLTGSKEH